MNNKKVIIFGKQIIENLTMYEKLNINIILSIKNVFYSHKNFNKSIALKKIIASEFIAGFN